MRFTDGSSAVLPDPTEHARLTEQQWTTLKPLTDAVLAGFEEVNMMDPAPTSPPLTVTVTLVVTLDPDDWAQTFGVGGRAAIRQDVKDYVLGLVRDAGVFGDGEVPARVVLK